MFNFRNYKSHTYLYEKLNEGLITLYSIDSVKKYLKNFFKDISIDAHSYEYNPYYNEKKPSNNAFVGIRVYDNFDQYKSIIDLCNKLYGWFTSSIIVNHNVQSGYRKVKFDLISNWQTPNFYFQHDLRKSLDDYVKLLKKTDKDINYIELVIEAKHPRLSINHPRYLYHLTNKQYIDKIKKSGLIPKSKYNYPERIYLSYNKEDLLDMMNGRYNDEYSDDRLLLKIDSENLKLYHDDRRDDALFTYDNIPWKNI